jgi:hypothetical protein
MAGRHVFFESCVVSALIASQVAGHAGIFVKAFYRALGVAHIELFTDQPKGHAVVMALDFHMVVDVDGGLFPFSELVGLIRQRFEGRLVDFVEGRVPAAGQLLKGISANLREWVGGGIFKEFCL